MTGRESAGIRAEELAPVRTHPEWVECRFEGGQQRLDGCLLGLPGEVQGDAGPLVVRAQPEVVTRDAATI